MLEYYLNQIADVEFSERDRELPLLVTQAFQEMNSRGVLYSTMTLQAMSRFFRSELFARCDFLKDFVIAHPHLSDRDPGHDVITVVKNLYQRRAFAEQDKLRQTFDSSTKQVKDALSNDAMKEAICERLFSDFKDRINKNNLYVEVAFRELERAEHTRGHVLILQPNFSGIGVNLKELWSRYLEPLFHSHPKT